MSVSQQRGSDRRREFRSSFSKFARISAKVFRLGNDWQAHKLRAHLRLKRKNYFEWIAERRVNLTVWKASLIGWKCSQKLGKMLARFNVFDFNFVFTLFLHITFKHCCKNGRKRSEVKRVHWKMTPFYDQCFIRSNPKNLTHLEV